MRDGGRKGGREERIWVMRFQLGLWSGGWEVGLIVFDCFDRCGWMSGGLIWGCIDL